MPPCMSRTPTRLALSTAPGPGWPQGDWAQAAYCDSMGGSRRAWQACGWCPPGPVNRPLFGQPGPHPALGWPRPDLSLAPLPACPVMSYHLVTPTRVP